MMEMEGLVLPTSRSWVSTAVVVRLSRHTRVWPTKAKANLPEPGVAKRLLFREVGCGIVL